MFWRSGIWRRIQSSTFLILPQRQTALVARQSTDVDLLNWIPSHSDSETQPTTGLGGSGEKAFDRAARLADGFIFFGGGVEACVNNWTQLRDRVAKFNRSTADFGGEYVTLSGSDLGKLVKEIDVWRASGGTHFTVVTMGLGLDSIDAHVKYVATLSNRLGLS
jgi:hypothetical protein